MTMQFDKYASKGNEMVNKVANELEVPRDQAARILRSVLLTLRDHLTLQENFDFLSQLPMAIKGVYVDGWNPVKAASPGRHLNDFLLDVRSNDRGIAAYDFGNDHQTGIVVHTVFKVLREYVSAGEWGDIESVLPKQIKNFISNSIYN